MEDLDEGRYYWVEIGAPEGYTIDDEKHYFNVTNGKTTRVTVENVKTAVPEVFGLDHYAYVIGYPDGGVHPEATIIRAEVATIFFRLLSDEVHNFYMTESNTFKPNQLITRAEAMTLVNRVLQRIVEDEEDLYDDMLTWYDHMDTTKWYYLAVQEATNSHYYVRKQNGFEIWTAIRPVRDWIELEQ